MTTTTCCVCNQPGGRGARELRPYGPGGKPICYECGMRPENVAEVERQFNARLDFAGPIAVLTPDGPVAPASKGEEPS
jgi:hypothetical protein